MSAMVVLQGCLYAALTTNDDVPVYHSAFYPKGTPIDMQMPSIMRTPGAHELLATPLSYYYVIYTALVYFVHITMLYNV